MINNMIIDNGSIKKENGICNPATFIQLNKSKVFTSPFGVLKKIPKLITNEKKMDALPIIPTHALGIRLFAMPLIKNPSNGNNGIKPTNFNII